MHGMAGMPGTVTQHTLTHRCSIAALGLGFGTKGPRQWVASAGAVVAIVAETAKAVAVA
jgi:hypothetical protein